ncbi:alkaline shock response membrane anchor protein AmaP [Crassaminicella thermophila]|uniref:Alkaline shock response membrane anchor protein AmaP n=1 Tax=Crassaminicella thermophila TaxID=2599308 RepID=A0A5C0SGQ8_CRATE|nr:alkaline shock response membrane anchor protein AmaP [Crassaminicella thermophila]QEK12149.1 alkaline shock response membrane anchor protein AmaP [Crassaminicella thermophila]
MKLIDRFFISIYTLLIAIISIVLILVPINDWIYNWTSYFLEQYRLDLTNVFIPVFFLIISIRFLISGINSKKINTNAVIRHTDFGEVKISMQAIEGMAQKSAKLSHGLRDIKATAQQRDDSLIIIIKALALSDINIPSTVINIQKNIKEHIEESTGIIVKEIKVNIDDIAIQSKKRVE